MLKYRYFVSIETKLRCELEHCLDKESQFQRPGRFCLIRFRTSSVPYFIILMDCSSIRQQFKSLSYRQYGKKKRWSLLWILTGSFTLCRLRVVDVDSLLITSETIRVSWHVIIFYLKTLKRFWWFFKYLYLSIKLNTFLYYRVFDSTFLGNILLRNILIIMFSVKTLQTFSQWIFSIFAIVLILNRRPCQIILSTFPSFLFIKIVKERLFHSLLFHWTKPVWSVWKRELVICTFRNKFQLAFDAVSR